MRTPKLDTITARVTATALLSEFLLAPAVVTAALPQSVSSAASSDFSAPVKFDPNTVVSVNLSEPQEIKLHEPEARWSRNMEKRFEQLSIAEALDTLSPAERDELETLTKERRRLHHPRTADELLFEYRQRKVTADLVKAVNEYVKFHDVPHPTRAAAR